MGILNIARELQPVFARMGARLDVSRGAGSLDVRRDRGRERFVLEVDDEFVDRVLVRDLLVRERHLLLEMRVTRNATAGPWRRFLCGHDEREWFAAAIPEKRPVTKVRDAFEALKPAAVRWAQNAERVPIGVRNRRRNEAFVRQGEWFFVPRPSMVLNAAHIRRDEPLSRTGGKPHVVEECIRVGGTLVYVLQGQILSEAEHRKWLLDQSGGSDPWRPMRQHPQVFARGTVRHADHATIRLRDWHEVFVNNEHLAVARANLRFLD